MLPISLLERLADGREHPRDRLRDALGVGRDELDRQLDALQSTGLEIIASANDQLCLKPAIDWIDVAAIESALPPQYRERLESLERKLETESTNRLLLDGPPPAAGMSRVAIAEYQTAGRGRRGRRWSMPPGSGIALSASWIFDEAPAELGALSLAVGTAARRAILELTGLAIGLKWPNDLIVDGGKLGGILVELAKLPGGACHVVAGIGVNVLVPPAYLATVSDLRHGARDLATHAPRWSVDRAALATRLIGQFIELFTGYAATGFSPYRAEWLAAHVLDGREVEIRTGDATDRAMVRGIGDDGALIVEDGHGQRRRLLSGDVTIRTSDDARD